MEPAPRARSALQAGVLGAVYGTKIRGPHALVMALVFGRKPMPRIVRDVLSATFTHSQRLALFALVYTALQRGATRALGEAHARLAAFCAGMVGGAYVWGDGSPISAQLNLYLLARVATTVVRAAAARQGVRGGAWASRAWSALMWGSVMCLYEAEGVHPHMQRSLVSSMNFIYRPLRGPDDRRLSLAAVAPTAAVWAAHGLVEYLLRREAWHASDGASQGARPRAPVPELGAIHSGNGPA